MTTPNNDFVAPPAGEYKFKIGKHIASSLSGFIAGAAAASIIWLAGAYFTNIFD